MSQKLQDSGRRGRRPAREVPSLTEVIWARVRSAGGRVTSARRATVEVLLDSAGRHLSAEEVVSAVRSKLPEVAESTVYRNLAALEDLDVVTHVHLGHGPATFHLAHLTHLHLVCQKCGRVTEVPAETLGDFVHRVEQIWGFRVDPGHFAVDGVCKECQKPRPLAH